MDGNCGECRFWMERDTTFGFFTGQCRLKPPIIASARLAALIRQDPSRNATDEIFLATCFPVTSAEEWCGKFEQKR